MQRLHLRVPLLLLSILSSLAFAQDFTGKCVGVTAGDTITVMHNGKGERIRLYAIDAPEFGQAFGNPARETCASLVHHQQVTVLVRGTDRDGNTLADVLLPDGTILNQALVQTGMAWWCEEQAPENTSLKNLHQKARAQRIGLWADSDPVAPWDFRRPESAYPVPTKPAASVPAALTGVRRVDSLVYVTRSDTTFHGRDCQRLGKSSIGISRAQAQARGFSACSICRGVAGAGALEDESVSGVKGKSLRLRPDPAVSAYLQQKAANTVVAPPRQRYLDLHTRHRVQNSLQVDRTAPSPGGNARARAVAAQGYPRNTGSYVRGLYRSAPKG